MSSVTQSSFFFFYRLVAWPTLRAAFSVLSRFNKKIALGLSMRAPNHAGQAPWLNWEKNQQPIWFHCASMEFEYAKPVIRRLKELRPEQKILVTYFSPSAAQATKNFPGVDFATPMPWDTPAAWRSFLEWHRPKALLIARTDTWPEMLRQTKNSGIPTLLFSATFGHGSGRARGPGRWIARAAFSLLDQIFCVGDEDLETFRSLGFGDRVKIGGDTRYDQVSARLAQPKPLREELFQGKNPETIFVAGSTWTEDEDALIDVIRDGRKYLNFIVVPHEPTDEHLQAIESKLAAKEIWSCRYSTASEWPEGAVLLVDKIGILAELYAKGRFALVGGSFKKNVHSVMEPLAAGAVVFVGPHFQNNREAVEFQNVKHGLIAAVQPTEDTQDLFEKLELVRVNYTSEVTKTILSAVKQRSGRTEDVVKWCLAPFRDASH